jgi:phasin
LVKVGAAGVAANKEDVMAKEGIGNFEIPADMRAFAEKSVEQAKQAFDTFISAAQHAVNTAENQAASARTGAKEVGALALGFTQRNVASSFEFAEKLVRAKDAQEFTTLHADYVKKQIAALTEQAKELAKQAAKLAGQH